MSHITETGQTSHTIDQLWLLQRKTEVALVEARRYLSQVDKITQQNTYKVAAEGRKAADAAKTHTQRVTTFSVHWLQFLHSPDLHPVLAFTSPCTPQVIPAGGSVSAVTCLAIFNVHA